MPSPIAHGSIVMLAQPAMGRAWRALPRSQQILTSLLMLFACGAPDLDIVVGLATTGDAFANHGYQSHSLLLAPAFGVLFAAVMALLAPSFRRGQLLAGSWLMGTALYALHVGMDYLTLDSRGVGLFWPVIPERFASPFGIFLGVEHGEWWLWREHVLTATSELGFAFVVWLIARVVRRRRSHAGTGAR